MELNEQMAYTTALIDHIKALSSSKKAGLIDRVVLDNRERTFGNFGAIIYDIKSIPEMFASGNNISVNILIVNKKSNNHSSEISLSKSFASDNQEEIKTMLSKIYGI